MAVAGAVLLIAGAGWLSVAGGLFLAGPKANPYKPVWLLVYEGRDRPPPAGGLAALQELRGRLENGNVNRRTIEAIVKDALACRLEETSEWNPGWGDLFAAAAARGFVTQGQHAAYLRNIARPTMWIQPRMRSGTVPAHRMEWKPPGNSGVFRVGTTLDVGALRLELLGLEVDGKPVPLAQPESADDTIVEKEYWCPPGRAWSYSVKGRAPPEFPAIEGTPGKHTLTIIWRIHASRQHGDDRTIAVWEARDSQPIEIVASPQPLVELVTDERLRRPMADAFKVELQLRTSDDGRANLEGSVGASQTPVDCAFRIDLAFGDARYYSDPEAPTTTYSSSRGVGSCWFQPRLLEPRGPKPRLGDRVRVTLTPDPELAARLGIVRMWGEPIEHEVEVE